MKKARSMASINDNLFTILLNYSVPREIGCRFQTPRGSVVVHFSDEGLTGLCFTDSEDSGRKEDSVFQKAFSEWLEIYASLNSMDRWKYLAPKGTAFQMSVWKALNDVPYGKTVSYQAIAHAIGNPMANRAVGTAVGSNPISLLIPCHRVIQASGAIGNYRWGSDRKRALLDAEQEAGSDLRRLFQ
ncbi:MAG: methylated-DNA--[protein]-cysteine S-methyltransferase [Opitutaceae bacterium]